MKFQIGPIPENDFDPDASWRSLREPGPLMVQVLAIPIGIATLALFLYLWLRAAKLENVEILVRYRALFVFSALMSFPLLIIVHELLHAVVHPGFGSRNESIIGAWPQTLLFYAHYCGEMTRNRFLVVFATPFLVISVVPLLIASMGVLPPQLASVAAWLSIWNSMFACGDIFGFFLFLWQIPPNTRVRNKGWYTYWKPIQG
jgi:hypothetical protein